jgi:cytochrome c oxidase cbb3-type subunit 3
MTKEPKEEPVQEELLRDHVYDGIQEYDQKLPNWWLGTLYGAIVFTVIYWVVLHQSSDPENVYARIEGEMDRIEAAQMASASDLSDPATLWAMSGNGSIVASGKEVFMTNCASCHGQDLKGGIGVNLADGEWIHGSGAEAVFAVVDGGVLAKGMPAWGPVLGPQKVANVVAFVLSHHQAPSP